MAEPIYDYPFVELHGAVEKHGAINRRKIFRAPDGKIIAKGKKEMYHIANPRDFDKTPQTPGERRNHENFRQAAATVKRILWAANPDNNPTPEQLEELATWQKRFKDQLPRLHGNRPDPEASIDAKTGKLKRYVLFPAFIRAIVYNQLKSQQN
ncbi:MAG: hypothetical protein J6T19_01520 [Paludibacteraceae bacterium]|nr:hypothetical protein [Paludibacteraceae bacterium]